MPTRNISLTNELDSFIAERIETGTFESASEVVRAALRSMARQERREEAKIAYLQQAIAEGMASGIAEGDVIARVRKKAGLPPRTL